MNSLLPKIKNIIGACLLRKPARLIFVKPCYQIIDRLSPKSIVVDLGTGNDADFSQALIKKFGVSSYGFDPTKKHQASLRVLAQNSRGRFTFFDYAIADQPGQRIFYESQNNISGSFLPSHINIKNDATRAYHVKTITIENIFHLIKQLKIDILKMDIEGEEYAVIPKLQQTTLSKIDQLVIEFHHHCLDNFTNQHTDACVQKIKSHGFKSLSFDRINYLFYK